MAVGTLRRHADFNKLWAGQTLSAFGDRISRIAIPTIAIITLEAGAFEVGLLVAFGSLPFLLVSPFAGVWADRFPRRTIMIATDLGRLVAVGSVPLALVLGWVTMAQLYLVAALTGVLSVFFQVAYQAYLPALVGREQLVSANSKLQFTRSFSEVGGSAAGGALIQALGKAAAVLADALTFLVSAILVISIKHREPRPEPTAHRPKVFQELREGYSALRSDLRLLSLMSSTGLANLGISAATAIMLIFVYNVVGLSPGDVGVAFAFGGGGMLVGAALASRVGARLGIGPAMVSAVLLTGAAFVLYPMVGTGVGLVGPLAMLIGCHLLLGVSQSIYHIHTMSMVQGITPGHLLGRVNGLAMTVVFGSGALGAIIGGVVGSVLDVRLSIVLGGLLVAMGGLVLAFGPIRPIRKMPAPQVGPDQPAGEGSAAADTDQSEQEAAPAAASQR